MKEKDASEEEDNVEINSEHERWFEEYAPDPDPAEWRALVKKNEGAAQYMTENSQIVWSSSKINNGE